MARRFVIRGGLVLVGLVVLLALVAAAAVVLLIRRPFPRVDGTIAVPGLEAPVDVFRDEFGVPHIYAESDYDLFFAQGYVHAQDRFWQMEFWRHIGQGRMSEIAGEATLENDKFIRTMGWPRLAADTLAYYETERPDLLAILEAYSDGVNAYIAQNEGRLAVEYTVLGLVSEPWEVEPWTPLHTVAWSVVMSDDLSGNWSEEVRRAAWIKAYGEATVANLLPAYPYDRRPIIAPPGVRLPAEEPAEPEDGESTGNTVDWSRVNLDVVGGRPANGFALGTGPWLGSNNWVVAGKHTASGRPLLANDPHLGIQMPAIWYEMGLHNDRFDVVGFSFAGSPGIIIGHNDRIAWGATNVGPDVQDLYIEKINPSNPNQYEFEGEWVEMTVVEEVIRVNGGETVTLPVRLTHHGPIINPVVDGQSDVLAMRWTAAEPSRLLAAIFALNEARDYDEFRDALRFWDVPAQNVVYADVDGNIAYQMPGRIPIRGAGNGLTPVPGWTGDYEWEGWVPYEALPAILNPESGFIVTANNAVVEADFPYLLSHYWADGDRAQRITTLLAEAIAAGPVTAAQMGEIQYDSKSLLADSFIPLLQGLSSPDPQVQAALERLRGWDRQLRRDSVPAALFQIFYAQLVEETLVDELGPDEVFRLGNNVLLHELAATPEAAWWDDGRTEAIESREDILLRALEDAVAWLEEALGAEMNEWTWGRLHTATFVSNPVGRSGVGPVEALVNRGPFGVDGGGNAPNATGWRLDDPAAVRGHPSMRFVADAADWDASLAVLPTGQSGRPGHPHYDDMMPLWIAGEFHALRFSRTAVLAAAVDHLVLEPAE